MINCRFLHRGMGGGDNRIMRSLLHIYRDGSDLITSGTFISKSNTSDPNNYEFEPSLLTMNDNQFLNYKKLDNLISPEDNGSWIVEESDFYIDNAYPASSMDKYPYFCFIVDIEFKLRSDLMNYVNADNSGNVNGSPYKFFDIFTPIGSAITLFYDHLEFGSTITFKKVTENETEKIKYKIQEKIVSIEKDTWYKLIAIYNYNCRNVSYYLNGQDIGNLNLGSYINGCLVSETGESTLALTSGGKYWFMTNQRTDIHLSPTVEFKHFDIFEPFDPNPSYTPPTVPNPFTVETSSGWY